jgi:hypothetical protein
MSFETPNATKGNCLGAKDQPSTTITDAARPKHTTAPVIADLNPRPACRAGSSMPR